MAAMIEIYSEPVAGYPFVLEFNILHKLITKHSLLGLYKTPLFIFNLFADTADTITTEFCSDNYSRWPIWFAHLILREFVSIPFKRQFVKKLGYYTGNTTRTLIQEIKNCWIDYKMAIQVAIPNLLILGVAIGTLMGVVMYTNYRREQIVRTTKQQLKVSNIYFY